MKYKYYDQRGRLLCESDSSIIFNLTLYPVWKFLKCKIDEGEGEAEIIVAKVSQTVGDILAEKEEEAIRLKSKKRKKVEEDNQ